MRFYIPRLPLCPLYPALNLYSNLVYLLIIKQSDFDNLNHFFSCISNYDSFWASLLVSVVPGTPKTSEKKPCSGSSKPTYAKTKPR